MSEEIIKVLDYITEKLGVAIDWTTENALPYVEEVIGKFVTYNIVQNGIGLAFGVAFIIISLICAKWCYNKYVECASNSDNDNQHWRHWGMRNQYIEPTGFGVTVITSVIIAFILGIIFTAIGSSGVIKWSIIPEMALLEEIKYLVG